MIQVAVKGDELLSLLVRIEKYDVGEKIVEVISLVGRKMILEDGSWLMIRPSGIEAKVRFYVESRKQRGTVDLVHVAQSMLQVIGVLR